MGYAPYPEGLAPRHTILSVRRRSRSKCSLQGLMLASGAKESWRKRVEKAQLAGIHIYMVLQIICVFLTRSAPHAVTSCKILKFWNMCLASYKWLIESLGSTWIIPFPSEQRCSVSLINPILMCTITSFNYDAYALNSSDIRECFASCMEITEEGLGLRWRKLILWKEATL